MTTRRDFLKQGAAASGAIILGGAAKVAGATGHFPSIESSAAPLNVLVFGGTGFIGPHLVRELISHGHKVAIFSRGRRDGGLPPSVERLVGDRLINDTIPQGNLRALEGRRFDVVIDDPATDPRWVRQSATMLRDSGWYMFVSSTGVFHPYLTTNNDENGPVLLAPPGGGPAQYGHQKAQCEAIVKEVFGDRGTVVRPGYIVGPGDVTDRFSYWPQRLAKGGETLVPGKKTDPSQFVDVRDLTKFMVKLVEERRNGIYNVTGPRERLSFGEFIAEANGALGSKSELVWVDDYEFLRANRMTYAIPWMIPEGENEHHLQINNRKAFAAGLTVRPIAETVRDTWATWPARLAALQPGQQPNFRWITPEREVEVLAAWKARSR
jgi:2'-hydroxyisoflavone reductase